MTGTVPYDRVDLDLAGPPLRFHLIGIGGAGMSAIALVLAALGHQVSGSDRGDSAAMVRLRDAGIDAHVGHDARLVVGPGGPLVDIVGVSTAITADNPEIVAARAAGIAVAHRYDLLSGIGATRRTLAVSGTHGKTTTSAICALALDSAGLNPSFIIGGVVAGFGSGSRWTDSEWFVLEADESDSTFLAPPRAGAIITNIEADHLDHHGSFADLVTAFERFADGTDGPVVVCSDDIAAAQLAARTPGALTYGRDGGAVFAISGIEAAPTGMGWTVTGPDGVAHRLQVALPGLHLVRNATAAFVLATALGADPSGVAAGIARYAGVGRRFERRGTARGITFIDDYAHMPTEVRAVLNAAGSGEWGRVVVVFQPHRYSRTQAVWRDYAEAFDGADVVVVTDVYAAGEQPVAGVSGQLIVDAIAVARPGQRVVHFPTRADLIEGVAGLLQEGDLCLTLGAGDLTSLPDQLIEALS